MSTWWIVAAFFAVLTAEIETRLIGHYLSAVELSGRRKPVVHELQKKGVDEESAMAKKTDGHQRQPRRTHELLGKRSGTATAYADALLYRLLNQYMRVRTIENIRVVGDDSQFLRKMYLHRTDRRAARVPTTAIRLPSLT